MRISYPWSPPELLDGRSNGSVASDVYSLGATIWHLLVGRSPFSIPQGDNSTRALSARILHAAPAGHPASRRAARRSTGCSSSAWPSDPSTARQSALELARGLQRIESAAGLPRTAGRGRGRRCRVPPVARDPMAADARRDPAEAADDHDVGAAPRRRSRASPRSTRPRTAAGGPAPGLAAALVIGAGARRPGRLIFVVRQRRRRRPRLPVVDADQLGGDADPACPRR